MKFICQLRILPTRHSCFNQTRANLGAERLCTNGSSEGSGRKPRYMCRVKQLMMTVFPVARLIEDKAGASSTVKQSVIWELFICSWNSTQNINRQFPCKIPKKRNRVWKTLPIACLQCFCRFYELVEAVLGDFLFNGRCDLVSKPARDKTADKTSHRIISPKTAPRSSEKRQRHSKHTTGKVFQTLVWCLGIFHGKLPIIFNRISAPYKPALILRFCDLSLNNLSRFCHLDIM